jgi:hypothetical protein
MHGADSSRRGPRTRGGVKVSTMRSVACLLASFALQSPGAAEAILPIECAAEELRCPSRPEWAEVPTIREQLRERRERGINQPRLDRPDFAEPNYGAPGFGVTDPGRVIGR